MAKHLPRLHLKTKDKTELSVVGEPTAFYLFLYRKGSSHTESFSGWIVGNNKSYFALVNSKNFENDFISLFNKRKQQCN